MEEKSRRKFIKNITVVTAAVGSASGLSGADTRQSDKETAVILYHETSDWKRYYETLK